MPRQPRRPKLARMTDDPGYARVLERLVTEQRDTVLPTDADLDALARVESADVLTAEARWDQAQRAAGTGLEGLRSAKEERA